MMELLNRNIEVLREQAIYIAERLNEPSSVAIVPGYRGYYTALWSVNENSILLHSAYAPRLEAERMLAEHDFTQYSSLFIFGLGLGYHVLELLKRTGSQTMVYIMEPDWEIVVAAARVLDFREIIGTGKVVLAFGSETEIRARLDGYWTGANYVIRLHHSGFFVFPPLQRFKAEWVRSTRHTVLNLIHYHRAGMGISIADTRVSVTDIAANSVYLARSPHPAYLQKGWSKPVVIVLAGPSLNKNMHVLKEWQDKVTIFCVNTVFNKLLNYGIIPDATFSLDRTRLIFDTHYQRDEEIPESILFIGNPVVDPRIVTKFKHSIFILSLEEAFQRDLAMALDGRDVIAAGLSVTHYTFSMARLCGASPIILIGQDLAYGDGGHTHAADTVYEQDVVSSLAPEDHDQVRGRKEQQEEVMYIEGYYGGMVPSTFSWRMFRDWYEIELTRRPALVINATEGGARIAGTMQMSLNEALNQYVGRQAEDKESFLHWILAGTDEKTSVANMQKIKSSFEQRKDILLEFEKKCRAAIKLCGKASSAKTAKRLKKRYVGEVMLIVDKIFGDNWVYTLFRPEFVRFMEKCGVGLEGGSLAVEPEEKASYLKEMFMELLVFLPSLERALEGGIKGLAEAMKEEILEEKGGA